MEFEDCRQFLSFRGFPKAKICLVSKDIDGFAQHAAASDLGAIQVLVAILMARK